MGSRNHDAPERDRHNRLTGPPAAGGRESDPITVPALVFATAARFSVLRGGDLLLNETSCSNGYVFFRPSGILR